MPVKRSENRRARAVAERPGRSPGSSSPGHSSPGHRAISALATFLVIVTIMLAAADTSAPLVTAQLARAVPAPAKWKLAFSTDFPGTRLDASTWAECYPWTPKPPGCSNFGNSDEREWYLPSQVHAENGVLALVARRTPTSGSDVNGNPKEYTCRSGMVTTYPGVRFKYGFVQVVARLPFGKGLWPAIWLIPSDESWPPEIDIVEHWDTQPTSRATLHTKQGTQQRGIVNFPDADKGWHTFTLYWTQSRISIYYDGRLALTTTKGIPRQSMYLLLDLADENNSPGSCSGTMYVKSVNIWEPS
jgi:beta-glucanase (GH16 family)